jgi:hypothetical protein
MFLLLWNLLWEFTAKYYTMIDLSAFSGVQYAVDIVARKPRSA